MKLKTKKSFTILECIFSVFLLSIITISIFYGIFVFYNFQNVENKKIENLNEIENTFIIIKNNIKNNINFLEGIDEKKYNVEVNNDGELFLIKLKCKINGVLKNYEMYVAKEN